jgi:hypothetical protein
MRAFIFMALLSSLSLPTQANGCDEAGKTLQNYLQALRTHQLATVRKLLDPAAVFKVEWLDSTPSKFFTLNREDYLQQLKATWHFAREEKLEITPAQWQATGNACEAAFMLTEKRQLLGTEAGQESQLLLHLEGGNEGWRITGVKSRTRW